MYLSYDEAELNFTSYYHETLSIWTQSEECYKCDLQYRTKLIAYNNASIIVNTAQNLLLELRNATNTVCSKVLSLREHGIYAMNISKTNLCSSVNILHEPDQIYESLFILLGVYFGIMCTWGLTKIILNARRLHRSFGNNPIVYQIANDLGVPNNSEDSFNVLGSPSPSSVNIPTPPQISRTRVLSLDVLRGLSICLMIFVNYGGGKYALFEHSAWNGITIADFVFPWFVWIMGVSLTFSLCSKLRSGKTRPQLFLEVLKRSFYLIILGLVLSNWNNKKDSLRYCGVLQRLGVVYFFVASVETFLMRMQPIFTYDCHGKLYLIRDLIESWPQWLFTIFIGALHTFITFSMKVPNCPKGYLGPGGLAEHGLYFNCTGGAAGYIDRYMLGPEHIYANPTCSRVYGTVLPFDPEGLLGTLTTIVQMYLGVYAARVMLCFQKTGDRIIRWLLLAFILGLIGGWLCNFSREGGLIPLNKNLWSLSFVFVTTAVSFVLLSLFLLVVDHLKVWSGFPFHQAGKNAIFIYIGHIITRNQFPWHPWQVTNRNIHDEYTVMHVWGMLLWLFIAVFMYERKCFFAV